MIWETKKRSTFWLGWVRQTAINPITESLRASSPFCPFMIIALYTGHIWIQYTMRKKSGLVFLMALLSCCENITTELICAAFTWFKQLSQRTFHVFSHVYVVLESNLVWTCLDQKFCMHGSLFRVAWAAATNQVLLRFLSQWPCRIPGWPLPSRLGWFGMFLSTPEVKAKKQYETVIFSYVLILYTETLGLCFTFHCKGQ